MRFSNQLQQIMNHFGLTTTELADKILVPKATISHLISERNKPSLEFIMKLHTHFPSLNLEWLIYGKEPFLVNGTWYKKEEISTPTLPTFNPLKDVVIETKEEVETTNYEKNEDLKTDEEDLKIVDEIIQEKITRPEKHLSRSIESIVVFYTDGSFKQYKPQ